MMKFLLELDTVCDDELAGNFENRDVMMLWTGYFWLLRVTWSCKYWRFDVIIIHFLTHELAFYAGQ